MLEHNFFEIDEDQCKYCRSESHCGCLYNSNFLDSHSTHKYQRRYEAEKKSLDQNHNVIKDISELIGWTVTGLRRWKVGVVQYTAIQKFSVAITKHKIGYAKDEVFSSLQLPLDDL
jgi:hypothetical protein